MTGNPADFSTLFDLGTRLGAHSRGERVGLALHAARALVPCDGAAVVTTSRRGLARIVLGPGSPMPREAEPGGDAAMRVIAQSRGPLLIADLSARVTLRDDGCPGLDSGPVLFAPIRSRQEASGYLALYRAKGQLPFHDGEARLATMLAAWTALALENLRLSERVEKLAITDDLTQVYNYRFLKQALRREILRASRFAQEMSMVMLDVDNLKAYNDRHGHLRGSYLLKCIAQLLSRNLRSFDLIAKYGGDEFTLILPQTSRDGAAAVAERMRAAVEGTEFPLAARGAITISLGVSTYPHDATDSMGLIRVADLALYRAKQSGRNRTELHSDEAA